MNVSACCLATWSHRPAQDLTGELSTAEKEEETFAWFVLHVVTSLAADQDPRQLEELCKSSVVDLGVDLPSLPPTGVSLEECLAARRIRV